MAHRPKRATLLRAAIGLASLALPLVATSAAQAAIAGAQPASMTAHPVLRSATIDSSNPYEVHVCYDKAILLPNTNSYYGPDYFSIGGYRSSTINYQDYYPTQVSVDPNNANCLRLYFNSQISTNGGSTGLTQYTVLTSWGGAVQSANGGGYNYNDTVGLSGSTSHAGTSGNTTPPDLAGIQGPSSSAPDTYYFVFNKAVDPSNVTAGDFYIVNQNGVPVPASAASVVTTNPNYVAATFPGQGSTGARGYVTKNGVYADYDPYGPGNVNEGSAVTPASGTAVTENAPYVTSATLNPDGDSITYTFDQAVVNSSATASDFYAELANGEVIPGQGVTANTNPKGTTTVTVTFNNTLAPQQEFAVVAWAGEGAVAAFPGGDLSVGSSAPIGGNPGAFARAFTTAPDVFGITLNKTGGTGTNNGSSITVNLDDRVVYVDTGEITLYDSTGASTGTCSPTATVGSPATTPSSATAEAAGPGPETVTLSCPSGALDNVTSVGFNDYAFAGTLAGTSWSTGTSNSDSGDSNEDDYSVPQIVAPVSTAALVRAYKVNLAHIKSHTSHKSHKARKAHRARRTHKKH